MRRSKSSLTSKRSRCFESKVSWTSTPTASRRSTRSLARQISMKSVLTQNYSRSPRPRMSSSSGRPRVARTLSRVKLRDRFQALDYCSVKTRLSFLQSSTGSTLRTKFKRRVSYRTARIPIIFERARWQISTGTRPRIFKSWMTSSCECAVCPSAPHVSIQMWRTRPRRMVLAFWTSPSNDKSNKKESRSFLMQSKKKRTSSPEMNVSSQILER